MWFDIWGFLVLGLKHIVKIIAISQLISGNAFIDSWDVELPLEVTLIVLLLNFRSVSHDSYFDTMQNSQNNSEVSLLDLSEIQLNFELEESEMRIFSEDESLVSSPRINKEVSKTINILLFAKKKFTNNLKKENLFPFFFNV